MPEEMIAGHLTSWRLWPQGGARPVLMLHCSLAHAGAWAGLAERLTGVTVTAPDLPGHGRSADWDGSGDFHHLTTRIAEAMAESLGHGAPVDLIGHSLGATIALRLALERPGLVRSLTLIEPVLFAAAKAVPGPGFATFQAAHLAISHQIAARNFAAAAAMFHAVWGNGTAFADLPPRQRAYIIARMPLIMIQNPVLIDDSALLLAPGRLENLAAPVLLVEGAQSPAIIALVHAHLARRLPQVQRLVVPGAGHMLPLTDPGPLAAAVQAHLAGC